MSASQIFTNSPCPHLPKIDKLLPVTHAKKYREHCGLDYFLACLELAQSLWRAGAPAQAILQLDKSFMANHTEDISPIYQSILWIIQNTPETQFIGNPVRHFQHLASRMNMKQPNAELRIWRAWACLHLTEKYAPKTYPRDEHQINKETLLIPTIKQTLHKISALGGNEESDFLNEMFS